MNRTPRAVAKYLLKRIRSVFTSRPKSCPLLIIERMEVDLVFSRLHAKHNLRIMDVGAHHGEFLDILELHTIIEDERHES